MGWENDQVVDVLKTISTTTDDELRKENIAMAVQILQQELPVIPVVWYQHTVAVNKKLRGVIIDPLQRSYGLSKMYWAD
jgi:peptide/nickel transport system substrate-binding protein